MGVVNTPTHTYIDNLFNRNRNWFDLWSLRDTNRQQTIFKLGARLRQVEIVVVVHICFLEVSPSDSTSLRVVLVCRSLDGNRALVGLNIDCQLFTLEARKGKL